MIALFLDKYWPYLLGLLGYIGLGAWIVVLQAQAESHKSAKENAELQLDLAQDYIQQQNAAVQALADAAEANRETYLAGLAAAENKAVRLEINAEDILSLPSPETPDEQCRYARELLIGDE